MKIVWIKQIAIVWMIAGLAWQIPAVAQDKAVAKQALLAEQLGWVADPNSPNCCFGYFDDPFIGVQLVSPKKAPITVSAQGGTFQQQGESVLTGHVVISQPGREITASTAHLNRGVGVTETESINLQGDVSLHEPGRLIIAKTGFVDLKTKLIKMQQTYYRMAFGNRLSSTKCYSTVVWGKAETIERQPDNVIELSKASYTTCSPLNPTWMMKADKIHLNPDTGRGVAKNVVLQVKQVPVFYLPYFNFPIDKRRQTGFLFPTFGTSNQQGFSFIAPFYWNLAPNYDDTITPALFGHRGVQLRNDFRYLLPSTQGEFYFTFLPNDSTFQNFKQTAPGLYANTPSSASLAALEKDSNNRYAVSWQNKTRLNDHWATDINYNYVSDDYYLQNFGSLPGVVTPNQLLREAQASYQGTVWNFKALLQDYLTLHPVNETPTQNQYNRMPEIDLNAVFPTQSSELNLAWDSQYVHFLQDTMPGNSTPPPTGNRLNLQPTVSVPLTSAWGYIVPSLQYEFTQYVIGGIVQAEGQNFTPNTINRELPIVDIDSGIYLEKKTSVKGNHYTQTLEPRIFYLYVPYKNQEQIPEFDTSLQPFGYNQLFLTNRFSGIDRVGDANQISFGVSSRFLNPESSQEVASFSLGQILYFQDRKVTFCTTPGCQDIYYSPGATPATTTVSPIAGLATFGLSRLWKVNGSFAWDPTLSQTNNVGAELNYRGPNSRVFNLGYNFLRLGDEIQTNPPTSVTSEANNLNLASGSVVWPIKERWRIFSGITYNISHVHAQNYLYGLEYDSCCWAMRLVAGRIFQSLNQNNNPVFNNTVFLQWQLKGLGNFGSSDPSAFLTGNIPGYRDNFGKTL